MIKNQRQYQLTKAQVARFNAVLDDLAHRPTKASEHPRLRKAQVDAVTGQRDDLVAQMDDYDALVSGRRPTLEIPFEELPRGLIAARIASGMTQGELAERLGLKEQQIQRYEASDYASASFSRIGEVVDALGVRIRSELRFDGKAPA